MSMTREHRQEDLSFAYISAVAAKAGYNCHRMGGHDYGIDLEIGSVEQIGQNRIDLGHRLHIQAKASHNFTTSNDDDCIRYDLKIGAYNALISEDRGTPAILVLYCMPNDEEDWLSVYEEYTTLRHCGYWISLRGMSVSTNKITHRIKIPKEHMFTDMSLKNIMDRIKRGDYL
jgi:hypothetical protein